MRWLAPGRRREGHSEKLQGCRQPVDVNGFQALPHVWRQVEQRRSLWIGDLTGEEAPLSESCKKEMGPNRHGVDSSPAQRTAVKQRPHQETGRHQVATSEPVVLHHGREGSGDGRDEVRPSVFNGLLGGASEALNIVELAQLLVECGERNVSGLAR